MAEKNIEFTKRLTMSLKEQGYFDTRDGRVKFSEKIDIPYTTFSPYLKKANKGKVPEWVQLLKIAEGLGVSVDWLLTGKDQNQKASSLFAQHADMLRNIHNSEDPTYINAIDQNLKAFVKAVTEVKKAKEEAEKEVLSVKKDVKDIKNGLNTLNEVVTTLSTGQPASEDKNGTQ